MQLAAETAKSAELAAHYSTLQGDMDAAEGKLDEMAQLNRSLVRIYTIYFGNGIMRFPGRTGVPRDDAT